MLKEKEYPIAAVAKRQSQIHRNTGFSNSWLRRLNQELGILGLDLTHKKVVDFAMTNTDRYPEWPEFVEAIIAFVKSGKAAKRSLLAFKETSKGRQTHGR